MLLIVCQDKRPIEKCMKKKYVQNVICRVDTNQAGKSFLIFVNKALNLNLL